MAWHHDECFTELGRCGSCGSSPPLAREHSQADLRAAVQAALAQSCAQQACLAPAEISSLCLEHAESTAWLCWGLGWVFRAGALGCVLAAAYQRDPTFLVVSGFLVLLVVVLASSSKRWDRALAESAEETSPS
jgi:hypothetical protein